MAVPSHVQMIAVESSNVARIGYEKDFYRLWVEFKDKKTGGVRTYRYDDFEPSMWKAFLDADSKGKFVYYMLRNHGTDSIYAYDRVD